jgi:membrane protease YdiL (CAAX protease family)
MKTCDYCGSENDENALHCSDCGTASPCLATPAIRSFNLLKRGRGLDAFSAVLVLLSFLIGAVVFMVCVGLITAVFVFSRHGRTLDDFSKALNGLMPLLVLCFSVGGGLSAFLAANFLAPKQLADPAGAAWTMGKPGEMLYGFVIGVLTSMSAMLFIMHMRWHIMARHRDVLHRLVAAPGVSRWLAVLILVLVGPLTEEMLFRGILFGGFQKSFGRIAAIFLTTLLFVAAHLPGLTCYGPMIVSMIGLAGAALWLRLRFGAIGPAIAVHAGYNLTVLLVNFS